MIVNNLDLKGLKIIKNQIFEDNRGYFTETHNRKTFSENILDCNFVQDNESKSLYKGTIRGLHAQKPPFGQDKLIRVIKGSIIDIAVDIRKSSKTYGSWQAVKLKEGDNTLFFIPQGFLHGFITLIDETIVSYKCSNYYNKESEIGVIYNDQDLSVDWKINSEVKISKKDSLLDSFKNLDSPF